MSEAFPWLPYSALGDARTAAPVARAVSEWSAEWLAAQRLSMVPRWEPLAGAAPAAGYTPVHEADGCRLLVQPRATASLAELLLGREVGERDCRTQQDRAVIEHLVSVALAALAERLGDTLRGSESSGGGEWFALPIGPDARPALLRLEATRAVLVALAFEWAGPPRHAAPPLPRQSSLDALPIRLSARIGTSRLTLPQIEALGAGDVLTLDTPLSDPVTACIDGQPVGDAALALVTGEDTLNLRIERPASQW